jgi:hypothetical protein
VLPGRLVTTGGPFYVSVSEQEPSGIHAKGGGQSSDRARPGVGVISAVFDP